MVQQFFVGCEQGAAGAEEEDGRCSGTAKNMVVSVLKMGREGKKIKEMAFIPYDNGSHTLEAILGLGF